MAAAAVSSYAAVGAGDGASSSSTSRRDSCAVLQQSCRQRASCRFKSPPSIKTPGVRIPLSYSTRKISSRQALKVDDILVTENWLANEEAVATAAAEEAMSLARAAAQAASDAAAYARAQALSADIQDFPSEMDLLRLERARLSEMERAFRMDFEAEAALLETERDHVTHLETLLDDFASTAREADDAAIEGLVPSSGSNEDQLAVGAHKDNVSRWRGVNVMVKSKRRGERLRRRERALEKAERVAASIACAPVAPKPKKPQLSQDPSDPIRAYLRDIGKTKLLTSAEEVHLSQGIQDLLKLEKVRDDLMEEIGREPTMGEWGRAAGMDQNAFESRVKEGRFSKDKMVNSNLRLVVSIAKNYQGRGMTLQDLIQEGSMGLIRGAEKFDSSKGFKFSTYAHWWIRQAVTRAIADQSRTIRLPIHLYEVISRINKAKKMLAQEHGRPPRDEEVAELVGMTVVKLKSLVKSARAPTSMERPIGKDSDATVGELVPDKDVESPEDAIGKQLLKQDLERVLCTLNPREKEVLRLRYGLDNGRMKTLEEIGHVFKVTRERIRQIEANAMRKLRQPSRNGVLREYLDVKGDHS